MTPPRRKTHRDGARTGPERRAPEPSAPAAPPAPDPLASALDALLTRLAAAAPAGFDAAPLRAARDRARAGEAPELEPLCAALAAAEAALEASDRAAALAGADATPEPPPFPPALLAAHAALAALQVFPVPAPGTESPAPLGGQLDLRDDPAPPGTVLQLIRRGFRRRQEPLVPVQALLSRGTPTALEGLLGELARGAGPLAAVAGELAARTSAARDARARGELSDPQRAAGLRTAAAALLRAWPADEPADDTVDGADLPARLLAALSGFDPELGPFPAQEDGRAPRLSPPTLRETGRYELVAVWNPGVAPGRAVRVLRPGLRELRPGGEALVPARVEVSLGPRPELDRTLDRLLTLWSEDPAGLAEAIDGAREAIRAVAQAEPEEARAARLALGQAASRLLDLLEARAEGDDRLGRELQAFLSGPLCAGLSQLEVTPLEVDDALRSALLRRRFAWSDAPAGEVLGWARRGLRVEDVVIRPGEVSVSAGPRGPLGSVCDALTPLLDELPAPLQRGLADRVGLERAIEADRLNGRPTHGVRPERERALGLLDALEATLEPARETPPALLATLEAIREGPLAATLAALGLLGFPAAGELLSAATRADSARYARVDGRADAAPRGTVLAVHRLGLLGSADDPPAGEDGTDEPQLLRGAEVTISLGPATAVLLAEGALPEPPPAPLRVLRDQLLDPRADVAEDAPARAAFAARGGAPAARTPALEALLRALEAEPFPAPGDPAPDADGADRKTVPDESPAGTLLRVVRPGLRWRGRVLERAVVEVSRGPLTPAQRALAAALAALPEPERAAAPGQELTRLLDELESLPAAAAEERLAALLPALEAPGCGEALGALEPALTSRGLRLLPEAAGEPWEALQGRAPAGAFLPPRQVCGPEPAGQVVAIERRALLAGERVLRAGRVRVAAGRESALHGQVLALRPLLDALPPEQRAGALEELDELLDRIAGGTPEREHLLALPVITLLHRLELKDKHGTGLKDYLREQGVRELIAYPNYEANKLGPSRLEEVRVASDRAVGRIVRVLRPGFERADGTVLQKVRAEVSR